MINRTIVSQRTDTAVVNGKEVKRVCFVNSPAPLPIFEESDAENPKQVRDDVMAFAQDQGLDLAFRIMEDDKIIGGTPVEGQPGVFIGGKKVRGEMVREMTGSWVGPLNRGLVLDYNTFIEQGGPSAAGKIALRNRAAMDLGERAKTDSKTMTTLVEKMQAGEKTFKAWLDQHVKDQGWA